MANPYASLLSDNPSGGGSYDLQLLNAQRQQRIAEQLQQQAGQQIPVNEGGGAPAPISWMSVLAKGLQGYDAGNRERVASDAITKVGLADRASADDLAKQLTATQVGTPAIAPQQTQISMPAPTLPGQDAAAAGPPITAQATIPGVAAQTGQTLMQSNPQAALAALIAAHGGPETNAIKGALMPEIFKHQDFDYQHGIQRQDKLDDNAMPMSTAMNQQIAAQSAATQANSAAANALPMSPEQVDASKRGWATINETRDYHKAMTGDQIGTDDPTALSHAKNILAGNEFMANVPKQYKNVVSRILADTPNGGWSPRAKQQLTVSSQRITAPYMKMPQYEQAAGAQLYLDRIAAAAPVKNSVADQELLDAFTRLSNNGNAISDAQVRLITDGRSFKDSVAIYANKLKNGGVLSDYQRQEIVKLANETAGNYRKSYQPIYDTVTAQLTDAGIDKRFWTIPNLAALAVDNRVAADKPGAPAVSFQSATGGAPNPYAKQTDAQIKAQLGMH